MLSPAVVLVWAGLGPGLGRLACLSRNVPDKFLIRVGVGALGDLVLMVRVTWHRADPGAVSLLVRLGVRASF